MWRIGFTKMQKANSFVSIWWVAMQHLNRTHTTTHMCRAMVLDLKEAVLNYCRTWTRSLNILVNSPSTWCELQVTWQPTLQIRRTSSKSKCLTPLCLPPISFRRVSQTFLLHSLSKCPTSSSQGPLTIWCHKKTMIWASRCNSFNPTTKTTCQCKWWWCSHRTTQIMASSLTLPLARHRKTKLISTT